jgi:hypothetical protein
MRVKIGNVEMDIDPEDLKRLLGLGQQVTPTPQSVPITITNHEPLPVINQRSVEETAPEVARRGIELIQESGMTLHSIVMVARKILHIETTGKRLGDSYDALAARASLWLSRPVKDTFTALFISEIKIPPGVAGYAVIGLNSTNQMVILAIEPGSEPVQVFKRLQARGLRVNSVKLIVLPIDDKIEKAAKMMFVNASVQRCWLSVISNAPSSLRSAIKDMMLETSPADTKAKLKAATKLNPDIKKYVEPYLPELLTYFQFDRALWRVLRGLASNERLGSELTRRSKKATSPEEAQILTSWIALRLQFHWIKIPVDSPQLSSLRYIKEHADTGAVSVRVPTQKSHIRRRPPKQKER